MAKPIINQPVWNFSVHMPLYYSKDDNSGIRLKSFEKPVYFFDVSFLYLY